MYDEIKSDDELIKEYKISYKNAITTNSQKEWINVLRLQVELDKRKYYAAFGTAEFEGGK